MTDLVTASKERRPLVINHPIGGRRLMAEVFRHARGIVFADQAWAEPGSHTIHFVEGLVRGEGPWTVGDINIEEIGEADPLFIFFADWINFLDGPDGQLYGREQAAIFAREEGFMVEA